jgi:hypothetical protein
MEQQKNNQAIINGGENLQITKFGGAVETVKVKLLKVSQFEDYLKRADNEARLAELMCDKPEGWGDELIPDSLLDVVEKGQDLNFTAVFRWADRRATKNEEMMPIVKKIKPLVAQLPTSAPTAQ